MARATAGTKSGSLYIVGTGIMSIAQCSLETKSTIESADIVFAVIPEPLAMKWVEGLNQNVHTMVDLYTSSENRLAAYHAMVQRILEAVRGGQRVCAVFYGHPGVFVFPSHLAIMRAREEGYSATMLPGISAADCLFADLGVDPSHPGIQMFEASAFLFWEYQLDPRAGVVLWQMGVLGDHTFRRRGPVSEALPLLQELLVQHFPHKHRVCLYEAAMIATQAPRMEWTTLDNLSHCKMSPYTTLYVPPFGKARPRTQLLEQLGISPDEIGLHG